MDRSPKKIDKSLLVDVKHPVQALTFISESLSCLSSVHLQNAAMGESGRCEEGAGYLLEFLALAIEDVRDALAEPDQQ